MNVSPGIPGTYGALTAHTARAVVTRARVTVARVLRGAAHAVCPCGTCAP